MIREGLNLFNVPQKLATDVKAYWMEYEKKKLTSKVSNIYIFFTILCRIIFIHHIPN